MKSSLWRSKNISSLTEANCLVPKSRHRKLSLVFLFVSSSYLTRNLSSVFLMPAHIFPFAIYRAHLPNDLSKFTKPNTYLTRLPAEGVFSILNIFWQENAVTLKYLCIFDKIASSVTQRITILQSIERLNFKCRRRWNPPSKTSIIN